MRQKLLPLMGAQESFSGTLEQDGRLPTGEWGVGASASLEWGFSTAGISTEDAFLFLLLPLSAPAPALSDLSDPRPPHAQTIKQREPPRSDAVLNGFGN